MTSYIKYQLGHLLDVSLLCTSIFEQNLASYRLKYGPIEIPPKIMNVLYYQVRLLQIPDSILKTKKKDLNHEEQEILDAGCAACRAIWAVSESYKSKEEIYRLNAVPYFAKLLNCCHEEMVIVTLGAITQCASQVLENEFSNY